jgi:uncharacterized phage protein (TIGR01671 family)
MNRTFDFRIWDKKRKQMLYAKDLCYWDFAKGWEATRKDNRIVLNETNAVLMQFTGYRDKRKKKIYEMDICQRRYNEYYPVVTSRVEWDWQCSQFVYRTEFADGGASSGEVGYYLNKEAIDKSVRVLGNMFEHPKKFKKAKAKK